DVVALDVLWAVPWPTAHERRERHHRCPVTAAHVEAVDAIGLAALRAFGLRQDAISAPEEVEVVDVKAAEKCLQREEHVAQRDAQRFDLVPVDLELDLRDARVETAVDETDFRT